MTEKRQFQPGDKVRCIDNSGAPNDFTRGFLYTVKAVDKPQHGDTALVVDSRGFGMFAHRFELVYAANPFKVGDKVRDKVRYHGPSWMKGIEKTVTSLGDHSGRRRDEAVKFGEYDWDLVKYLELVPSTPAQPPVTGTFIVIAKENGKLAPAASPRIHLDRPSAETEARRLGDEHPGTEFTVFQAVSVSGTEKPVKATTRAL